MKKKKKPTENRENKWVRPATGDLKFEPLVISRPFANHDTSIHVTYNLNYDKQSPELNLLVQRPQNTMDKTNYIISFLDSS